MGISITHADSDFAQATMPISPNLQPFGYLHGGASAILAETVASVAGCVRSYPGIAVGTRLEIDHLQPVLGKDFPEGVVTASAHLTGTSNRRTCYEVELTRPDCVVFARAKVFLAFVDAH